MDKNRKNAIIYYLTAAVCFVCSVIWFCGGKGGFGAMWLCIGSVNLCLGTVWMKRSQDPETQNEHEAEKSEET